MAIFTFFKKQNKKDNTVFFGKYFFENEKHTKPIEWLILESNDTEMLLISKYCLDTVPYCEPSPSFSGTDGCIWEHSYLRKWLNTFFYSQAFREEEKQAIVETNIVTDKTLHNALHKNNVFALSESQVCAYFADEKTLKGCPTPYALQKGAALGRTLNHYTWWWIMPYTDITGGQPARMDYPAVVCPNGERHYHSRLVYHTDFTVRPVIRIKT